MKMNKKQRDAAAAAQAAAQQQQQQQQMQQQQQGPSASAPPPPQGTPGPSPADHLAREKLALYVYEYLCHVGAKESAQMFLNEMQWHKQITIGEPPGFLHSWWCVFWDLYCAAPERRESCEHSTEAKAFHDYGFINSGVAVNGMGPNPTAPSPLALPPHQQPHGPNDPSGPPGGFFPGALNPHLRAATPQPSVSQPSPSMMPGGPPGGQQPGPFMPRFPPGGPRAGMRMVDPQFQAAQNGQPLFADSMGNLRQMHPGMMQNLPPGMRLRMPMNQNFPPGMRANGNIPQSMSPLNRPPWPQGMPFGQDVGPPMQFHGQQMPPGGMPPGGPGPSLMRSPLNMGGGNHGNPEGMFMMKASTPGNMGPGFPINTEAQGGMGVSEMLMNGDGGMDMRNSPSGGPHGMGGGPGTPGSSLQQSGDGGPGGMGDFVGGLQPFVRGDGDSELSSILKIKERMAQEARQFEQKPDTPMGRLSTGSASDHGSGEFFSM